MSPLTSASAFATAASLSYHDSVRGIDLTGWRLPKILPVNGVGYVDSFIGYRGESDIGENVSAIGSAYPGSTGSELAYMFYVNLGNHGQHAPDGSYYGCSPFCLTDVGPFTNLQTYQYWSGTEYTGSYVYYRPPYQPLGERAWLLDLQDGFQGAYLAEWPLNYAWAVRDGDVAAISEPETYSLILAGLALVSALRRRCKQVRK